ncbi:right-handed parallel beta-helix repeat-containing protein [Terrimonas sp. NA20]|uniref:Right-handed parallel beta-helix repeat-containing protein n=1 Tax=Terrimonas ginsenosidimutans TaxID=2908004 RepID=A0ABS9KRK2_9BACT|nr:right-handed parallel beta-helix repeat-containing protein [Terrimonas ginsenosidimutans]
MKAVNKTYPLAASGEAAAIVIEGNDITVDFNGAVLQGSSDVSNPDRFTGIAVEIRNSNKVTVRNLTIKGYKIALLVRNVENLVIENGDFSYNYRPRLQSTQQKEDVSDWLSYHHNENNEWNRYGAGICLIDCRNAVIRNSKASGNQNGLLMTRCSGAQISHNDFSFNSGLGIGLYRSSGNRILYNRLIYNIRGYSHGVYQRGQDSAGILAFEQCNNNLVYKNNVTHGGDGFFLWAGQTTMDSGAGGCNGNVLLANDFSYAATNGIELTFSSNTVNGNRIYECENGIWGGYSYNTTIRHNRFRNNKVGIAIEHGQDNSISYNLFDQDRQAIRIWANNTQVPDWGYAQKRDTRSRNYTMVSNSFNRNPVVFDLKRTQDLNIFSNTFSGSEAVYRMDDTVTGLDTTLYYEIIAEEEKDSLPLIPDLPAGDPFKGSSKWAGRKNIRMTEWGPYDFNYPIIWNVNPTDSSGWMEFEILGPEGSWLVKEARGLDSISHRRGGFPATIRAKRQESSAGTDIILRLDYLGKAFTDPFGRNRAAKTAYPFQFRRYFQPLQWNVLWYSLDTAYYNPLKEQSLFSPTARMAPVRRDTVQELNYTWWGGLKLADRTLQQFITTAGTRVGRSGSFELSVTWQGAVRIYLDDKIVLDGWKLEKKVADEADHRRIPLQMNEGQSLRVEHLGFAAFSALAVKLHPGQAGGKK